ncbi:MAG: hypothetical protein ACK4MQ_00870 [Hyphomonas sp.]
MTYALCTPLEGLSPLQRLLWPLIFAQLIALKAWVRAQYGPGVPYWIRISRLGRVSLRHMPSDFTASWAAPGAYEAPRFDYSSGHARAAFRLVGISVAAAAAPPLVHIIRTQKECASRAAACPDTS